MEKPKLDHLTKAALDSDDPVIGQTSVKLLALVLREVMKKLDLDSGVTDTNYESLLANLEFDI